ncbi:MAG: SCP2 sterol-binding domain-containing protein [Desulfobacter sp.]|nr:SCP2 sterol-binding domain-containing protein [Desulfobacter sp.]WDP84340.1 MAG: SCP2 sterol-binding domain-containing protein [Desulfobacter sp.]
MKYWDSPAQAITAFLKLMEKIEQDEKLLTGIKKINQLIWYDYTQNGEECSFWSDCRNNQFSYGPGRPGDKPNLTLILSADQGHLSWANKINAAMAITRGRIKIKGSAMGLLRLAPKSRKVAKLYESALTELGFQDKLEI